MNKKQTTADAPCLICGRTTPKMTRGLCSKHYMEFTRKKETLSSEAVEAWEDWLVENGRLLPNRQGQQPGSEPKVFDGLFAQFVEFQSSKLDDPKTDAESDHLAVTPTAHKKAAKKAVKKKVALKSTDQAKTQTRRKASG